MLSAVTGYPILPMTYAYGLKKGFSYFSKWGLESLEQIMNHNASSHAAPTITIQLPSGSFSADSALIIETPMETHGEIYEKAKAARTRLNGKKILILNMDAHHDKYPHKDDTHDATWARELEKEGNAVVLHLFSYWTWNSEKLSKRNWNQPYHRDFLLKKIEAHQHEIGEVWLTIDYDFFSLLQQFPPKPFSLPEKKPIYHMSSQQVEDELNAVQQFLKDYGIPVQRILPAISRHYLNVYSNPRLVIFGMTPHSEAQPFIEMVTEKIHHMFGKKGYGRKNENKTKMN